MRDTRIYVHAVWRLLTDRVLPLDYAAYARDLLAELERLQAALGERLSLDGLVMRRRRCATTPRGWRRMRPMRRASTDALMRMSRALVPINYTSGDRFAHDPALALPAWPTLRPLRELAAAVPGSDAARFLAVGAVRARNRVAHALREANAAAEGVCHS